MQVSVRDLRTQAKRLLAAVERGEEVVITFRGKPRAKVIPLEAPESRVADDELFGLWKDYADVEDVEGHVDGLRKVRF